MGAPSNLLLLLVLRSYRLESGEAVHLYRHRKDRVDEVKPKGLPVTSVGSIASITASLTAFTSCVYLARKPCE
jgi:hypothetical protein